MEDVVLYKMIQKHENPNFDTPAIYYFYSKGDLKLEYEDRPYHEIQMQLKKGNEFKKGLLWDMIDKNEKEISI
jgi:hypothetical protein